MRTRNFVKSFHFLNEENKVDIKLKVSARMTNYSLHSDSFTLVQDSEIADIKVSYLIGLFTSFFQMIRIEAGNLLV